MKTIKNLYTVDVMFATEGGSVRQTLGIHILDVVEKLANGSYFVKVTGHPRKTEQVRWDRIGKSHFVNRAAALRHLVRLLEADVSGYELRLLRAKTILSAARNGMVYRREYSRSPFRTIPTLPTAFATQ